MHGSILGKPENREHAREMLRLLRGRPHSVYSGICLWHVPFDRRSVRVAVAKLVMHPISDQAIEDYLDSDEWIGKAGPLDSKMDHHARTARRLPLHRRWPADGSPSPNAPQFQAE